ncbi:COP9 signalosome complex subunit 2 [Monoraphidium neglectum]|uniref:COP9 signalosome complex subunit 2 n=1 Tax=Monoraphidium neglectum TaxID=145388 RepID=A0A0D2KFH1_9CHLO|nr:COP9 signalosome complex subunit 2 [Monoraphidium neglectum]KIY94628.1 COP9 signalosome complex subunit 2 [Monoraphidium neglectum]|eukprot:XP_013893648.1 COP9 signalosome complex subunit 2 [Monoraphidium neglectum]
MSDDDMEDYGFEYSDEEQEEEDVDIENQYYNSKGMLEGEDPREALQGFRQVVEMEQDKGEWGFKALKQVVKLYYKMGQTDKMMEAYRQMLSYVDSAAVTRNASEKKLNRHVVTCDDVTPRPPLLDFVGGSSDTDLLQQFYETTLKALEKAKNDRPAPFSATTAGKIL